MVRIAAHVVAVCHRNPLNVSRERTRGFKGYATTAGQTLPDDASFHIIWSMQINVQANQLFILTGQIGVGQDVVGRA